jgi:hypothetical protein
VSLTWTEAQAAHAAQIYTESDELAESVAAYFAAGFEAGEPAILVATATHTSLVLERLAAAGWDAKRIDGLGLLVRVDADATLEQIMDGPLPADAAFERMATGLLDELASRFPETRVRIYGEMVDVLCRRGQQSAAVALEQLWNRLARTRNFALLCGYRLDVFDRQAQVDTLRSVCNLHTHVAPSADTDRLAHAVDDALVGVLGAQGAGQVYSLVGSEIRERRVPPPQLALLWVSENMPMNAERILSAARTRYGDTPASTTPTGTDDDVASRPESDALRAILRKATRTRRLS